VSCFSLTQRFSNSPLLIPLLIPYTPCFQEIVLTFCGVCGIPEVLGFSNPHASINGNAEELRAFYKQEYSHLDKENREEIVQAALLISRLTRRINFAFFARNDWRDQVQERERMQLKGPSGHSLTRLGF
jgi:hypothetical protein